MAEKKAVKKVSKKGAKKGDVYECGVCGLEVTVNKVCDCVDDCDILCCERAMKPKIRT